MRLIESKLPLYIRSEMHAVAATLAGAGLSVDSDPLLKVKVLIQRALHTSSVDEVTQVAAVVPVRRGSGASPDQTKKGSQQWRIGTA
jgi:hypothetical protein